jgi:acetyltransferase-like isoleucine patch superfamily enzyme
MNGHINDRGSTEPSAPTRSAVTLVHGRVRSKSVIRRVINRLLGKLARSAPGSTTIRPLLHRWRGVEVDGTIFIGEDVYLENEYPEQVTIGSGAQIGLRSIIIAHTREVGRVVIGRDVFIGASCVIIAQGGAVLTIGDGAVIAAGTVVASDVPAATLIAAERAVPRARVTVPLRIGTDYKTFRKGLRPLNYPGGTVAGGQTNAD